MKDELTVPRKEYAHYDKYLRPESRFCSPRLADLFIEHLKFKNISVMPGNVRKAVFPYPEFTESWYRQQGIARECPPTDYQREEARAYLCQFVHYQHWTVNADVAYEQMVGDECYDGINGTL